MATVGKISIITFEHNVNEGVVGLQLAICFSRALFSHAKCVYVFAEINRYVTK